MQGVRLVLANHRWLLIEPHLPGRLSDPGVTAKDNRQFVEAVLWTCGPPRRGATYRRRLASGTASSPASTAGRRMGVWWSLFNALSDDPDFEYLMVDSTIVRARQHATGKKGGLKIAPLAVAEAV